MPCSKCKADFNIRTWKLRCKECDYAHCTNCLQRQHGGLFCEKCVILNKRPPDRDKLMELRSKDLQDYLKKHNISTHGLVEKAELVELFYRARIPVNGRRGSRRMNFLFNSGSVPNIPAQSQEHLQNIRESINNIHSYAQNALHNFGRTVRQGAEGVLNPQDQEMPVNVEENSTVNAEDAESANDTSNETNSTPSTPRYPKLSDFSSAEELTSLSVKQLKELLALNRVEYKGCVEKSELLERATMLWMDDVRLKSEDVSSSGGMEDLCKICMDAPLDCVILECGHVVTCVDCGKRLAECPVCRQFVTRVVRTFKA